MKNAQKKIGLLTSRNIPNLIADEKFLLAALKDQGMEAVPLIWDASHDWSDYQYILVRNPWDYFEKIELFWNTLKIISACTRLINPLELMQWNLDKHYLLELAKSGVRIAPTYEVQSLEHVKNLVQELGFERYVIKPFVSAGAYKTYAFGKISLPAEIDLINFSDESFMLQPFVEKIVTQGEASLIYFDHQFSHAILKKPKQGDFRVQEDFGGEVAQFNPSVEDFNLAQKVLELLPLKSSYARVDISWDQEGPCLMEVELIEPELFFRFKPSSAEQFAKSILAKN